MTTLEDIRNICEPKGHIIEIFCIFEKKNDKKNNSRRDLSRIKY